MLKKLLLTSAFSLVTFANINTNAFAQSVPFGVTGIVSPSSCTVSLTGGTVNLGTIMQTTVKGYSVYAGTKNPVYLMISQNVPIGVTCTTAARVALLFVDNKSTSVFAVDNNDILRFGLTDGAGSGTAIGSYQLAFNTADTSVDGAIPGTYLNAPGGTTAVATWSNKAAATGYGANIVVPSYLLGFAKAASTTTPEAFTTLSGSLNFRTYLSKAYIDSATTAVTPIGSGTLTLVYL